MDSMEGNIGKEFVPTPELAEEQYVNAKISIWWDFERCEVLNPLEAQLISKHIVSALVKMNYRGRFSISAYGDTNRLPRFVQESLIRTGVSINHVSEASITRFTDPMDKNKKILVDMLIWAMDNPAPANYLLISGDPNFSYAINRLLMRGYNILLAQPNLMEVSAQLIAAAKHIWLWDTLVAGGSPLTSDETFRPLLGGSYHSDRKKVDQSMGKKITMLKEDHVKVKPKHVSKEILNSQITLAGLALSSPRRTILDSHSKSQVDVILQAVNTLKAEKMMPTEANIADCIRTYGDPKHRNINVKRALEIAMENQLVVKQIMSDHQLYIGDKERPWNWVDVDPYEATELCHITAMNDLENFLSSSIEGRSAILSSESRFEAATIIKRMCLKSYLLGEVILIFNMMLRTKKWVKHNPLGWQPVSITLAPKSNTNIGSASIANIIDDYL